MNHGGGAQLGPVEVDLAVGQEQLKGKQVKANPNLAAVEAVKSIVGGSLLTKGIQGVEAPSSSAKRWSEIVEE